MKSGHFEEEKIGLRKRVSEGNNSVMNQLKMSQQQSTSRYGSTGGPSADRAGAELRRETVSKYVRNMRRRFKTAISAHRSERCWT